MCDQFDHPLSANTNAGTFAVSAAFKASKVMTETSSVFDTQREASLPRFSLEEMLLGDALGRGGFNDVFEVQQINIKTNADTSPNDYEKTSKEDEGKEIKEKAIQLAARNFTTEHCIRKKTNKARYAIKFLSPNTMKDISLFQTGAADLITEAMFLSSLEHPNIIKIRGVSDQGVSGFASGLQGGFFILLDRLQETLEHRLDKWAAKEKKTRHFLRKKLSTNVAQKRFDFFTERLHCALDISAALAYLHSRNIAYRDLKPENIGFDCRGDVKIFDFGLSTELLPHKHLNDGLYNLSGQTGSLRYMAPEVAKSCPYNLSADVYSFSILLWELCSLQVPYDGMDRQSHSNHVVFGSHRPALDSSWCFPLRSLMARSWSEDINSRPQMHSCYQMIKGEVVARRGGDATGLEHTKRRSTYLFKFPSKGGSLHNAYKIVSKAKAA